jgi:hypothetical protein
MVGPQRRPARHLSQRSAGVSASGLISNAATASTYRRGGFGSEANATPPAAAALDLADRLDDRSQTLSSGDSAAFRAIWRDNFATSGLLKVNGSAGDTNGGAVFVTIRAGTGADRAVNPYTDDPATAADRFDGFEKQLTDQAKGITDRFGTSVAVLGYDLNDNGYLDSERELFGFDGATAGPSLSANGLVADRFMVLTAGGQSVRVTQSSFATTADPAGGYLPYTTASTVLRPDAATGRLEIAVVSTVGLAAAPPVPAPAWVGIPRGNFAVGDDIRIAVTYGANLAVAIDTDPAAPTTFNFAFDGLPGGRSATLESASGATLVFRYTVQSGDVGATGLTVASGATIGLGGTTTIRDTLGRAATLVLPGATNPAAKVP